MLLSIAYRNIWRNPLRTWILICSIAIGMFAGIFSLAFSTGLLKDKTDDAINNNLSHLQTHRASFENINNLGLYFPNAYEKCIEIGNIEGVKSTTYRLIVNAIISSRKATTGIKISGIVPEIEQLTTSIHNNLISGNYFKNNIRNAVIISEDIAERLNLYNKSAVELQFHDIKGNMVIKTFTVCGIYKTKDINFDNENVFVRYDDLIKISRLPRNTAHEIAIILEDEKFTYDVTDKIKELFPYLTTENWKKLSPILSAMHNSNFGATYLIIILILIALSFGITNSMSMIIIDRMHELGMLMAVGMNRFKIFAMLMLETIKITLFGGFIGIFIGMVVIENLGVQGLNIAVFEEEMRQMGYDAIVYPHVHTEQLVWVILLILITAILSSIYPAIKAIKYKPTDSIKKR